MISPRILIQIQWFLIPWLCFQVLFPKILIFLISHHDSSSDLIKFQKIIWNYPISPWKRPLFTTILLNLWLFDKITEFGISFDMNWCVINDRFNSFHHSTTHSQTLHLRKVSTRLHWTFGQPHIFHSIYVSYSLNHVIIRDPGPSRV